MIYELLGARKNVENGETYYDFIADLPWLLIALSPRLRPRFPAYHVNFLYVY